MKNQTVRILSLASILLGIFTGGSFADVEPSGKVLASITRIVHPNNSDADNVTISMTVHSPSRFGGLTLIMVTDSKDREKIRASFPSGSLQILELPAKTFKELEEQVAAHTSVEKTLDSGIDPARTSQTWMIPTVNLVDLLKKPTQFTPNIEEAEPGGAGQRR